MDTRKELRLGLFAILITTFSAVGCQSSAAGRSVRYDNVGFMDVWTTYTHCLSAKEAQAAILDSTKLHEVSQSQENTSPLETFVRTRFKSIVAHPSSRLAVDVHAMAAACSLHTGTLALSVGEHDLARIQFHQILKSYTQSDYSYYAEQARARLSHLEQNLQAALR